MRKQKTVPEQPGLARAASPPATPYWPLAVLFALTLGVYLPAMNGPFLFDDLSLPILSGAPPAEWTFYLKRGVRSIFNLSLLVDYHLWGLNPGPFHWVNLMLHLANGWLVYAIVRAWARPFWLSIFGAGVFLLHPLQTEAVSYIASRSECLSVLFSYAALLVFLRRERSSPTGWRKSAVILVLMGLAVLSKESAAAMAGVFVLTDLVEGGYRRVFSNWRVYAPLLGGGSVAAAYIIRLASREGSAGFGLQGVSPVDYLWTQFQVIPVYIRLLLLPWGQNLDHAYPLAKAPASPLSYAGLSILLLLLYLAWRARKDSPLVFLGFLIFLALLAPTSSFIPIADTMVERRLYLPMIGPILAACQLLGRVAWNRTRALMAGAAILFFAGLTMLRNDVYTSPAAMWADSVKKNPGNQRAHFQLAYAYYRDGRCAEANTHYSKAAALGSTDYELLIDWALSLDCAGDPAAAIQKLQEAARFKRDSHAWATLGMIYGKRGQLPNALDALNRALEINRRDANAFAYRGNVQLASGRIAEAIEDFSAALQISPDHPVALQGMAAAQTARRAKQ